MVSCECPVCTRHRMFEDIIKRYHMEGDDKRFLEGMEATLENEENDAQYYKSILEGRWPQSIKILERALSRAKKIRGENK